jgi:alkylation response protein AidB-like acyl-CoA dehydrogenase
MGDVPRGGSFLMEPVGSHQEHIVVEFTEDQLMYARTAEDFVKNEVLPRLQEIEEKKEGLMPALLKRAGELGLLMIDVPEKYGGLGLSKTTSMLIAERSAKCASFSISWGAHTGIGTLPLVYYGNERQRQKYLPRLATGEMLGAYALTEPEAGSDALAAKTVARQSPDGRSWVLSGVKQFITNAGFADLFTVFAKVDGEKFTAFLVEREFPGVSTGPEEQKLGIRGSSTRQLILDGARVPAENVLGQVGQGHKIAFNILNIGRFKLGAGVVGAAKECLDTAVAYGIDRKQLGTPIVKFGMIQRKIADMATRIYAADSMSYRTAALMDGAIARLDPGMADYDRRVIEEGIEEYTMEDSIVKVFGTETLDFVADESLQMLGGYGFTEDYPIERHYRDQRINRIFEGTNEINRLIIPATLMKRVAKGRLPYLEFMQRVDAEIQDEKLRPVPPTGPLAREIHAVEMAKRVVAYTAKIIVERELASLTRKQQHVEILSNLVIDLFAADSTASRTLKLVQGQGDAAVPAQIDMTHVFVSSALDRITGGARRLLANEAKDDDELKAYLARLDTFVPFFPIRTIDVKTRIAERVVADRGWRFSAS